MAKALSAILHINKLILHTQITYYLKLNRDVVCRK